MSKPGWLTYLRDVATFMLGLVLILKQAGIFFAPPAHISIELLTIGALCCNVPGILQVIAWRSGQRTDSPPTPPASPLPGSQPSPSPAPSGGGE